MIWLCSYDSSPAGISADPCAANLAFREKYGFTFPLLSDPGRPAYLRKHNSMRKREYARIMRA